MHSTVEQYVLEASVDGQLEITDRTGIESGYKR